MSDLPVQFKHLRHPGRVSPMNRPIIEKVHDIFEELACVRGVHRLWADSVASGKAPIEIVERFRASRHGAMVNFLYYTLELCALVFPQQETPHDHFFYLRPRPISEGLPAGNVWVQVLVRLEDANDPYEYTQTWTLCQYSAEQDLWLRPDGSQVPAETILQWCDLPKHNPWGER